MGNQRRGSASKQEGCEGSKSDDLSITDMPYAILILILSLLPVEDAVVTSSVMKKWRFLWSGLTQLNFDARKSLSKIAYNKLLYSSERSKYIEQVNSVIRNYHHPVVHRFRINFDLCDLNQRVIDEWLQFAVNKKKSAKLGSIPQLPNLKNLMLTIGAYEDDCLLEFASIAKACPILETFIIELLWFSPNKTRRKRRHVANDHYLENLKLFKILGYYGRISDFELASYVIEHAVALQEIVIDPHCQHRDEVTTLAELLEVEAARASAKRQLKRILPMKPPGLKLVIL